MDIDSFLVGVYLALALCIGIFNHQAKDFKDYAIAPGTYSIPFLVATILATFIGSLTISLLPHETQKYGIVTFIIVLGDIGYLLIMGHLAWRFNIHRDSLTIGGILDRYWGKKAQIICGLLGTIYMISYVSIQTRGMGLLVNAAFGINYYWSAIIGSAVLIFYSTIGGIRAVTYTDTFQFFMTATTICAIFLIGLECIPEGDLWKNLPESHKNFNSNPGISSEYWIAAFTILIPILNPSIVQRALMAPNPKTARRSFVFAGIIALPIYILIIGIGLVNYKLNPNAVETDNIFLELIKDFLPVGLKGFAIAGVLAIIMSTADSYLNTGGVILVHDLIEPLLPKPLSERGKIILCKTLTGLIGFAALYMSLTFEDLLKNFFIPYNFWGPVVTVPTLFAIYGVVGSKFCFFGAALSGMASVILWKVYSLEKLFLFPEPAIFSMTVSGMIYYFIYMLEKSKTQRTAK